MWKERKSYNTYTCKIQANHTGNNNNNNNNIIIIKKSKKNKVGYKIITFKFTYIYIYIYLVLRKQNLLAFHSTCIITFCFC